jgi:hypothetical protein
MELTSSVKLGKSILLNVRLLCHHDGWPLPSCQALGGSVFRLLEQPIAPNQL